MICRFSLILGQLQLPLLLHGGGSHDQVNMTLEIMKSVSLTSLYISLACLSIKPAGGPEPVHLCLGLCALPCKPTVTTPQRAGTPCLFLCFHISEILAACFYLCIYKNRSSPGQVQDAEQISVFTNTLHHMVCG